MNIISFDSLQQMMDRFNFKSQGSILQTNLKECHNETETNERQYHDAEVLTTLAKNLKGDCLEIGTSTGEGTYKIATNTDGKVFTLNALREQLSGHFVTHALKKEQIGSYLVEKGVKNFVQIYADSMKWDVPQDMPNVSMVFIDGCHDTEYVYQDSRKTVGLLRIGGFMVWHDFNPDLRRRFSWIDSAMCGAEKFCREYGIKEAYHLKDSWMGFWQKF